MATKALTFIRDSNKLELSVLNANSCYNTASCAQRGKYFCVSQADLKIMLEFQCSLYVLIWRPFSALSRSLSPVKRSGVIVNFSEPLENGRYQRFKTSLIVPVVAVRSDSEVGVELVGIQRVPRTKLVPPVGINQEGGTSGIVVRTVG